MDNVDILVKLAFWKIIISYSEGNKLKVKQDGNTKVIQCPNFFLVKEKEKPKSLITTMVQLS
jgi:hypothetical protein